MRSPGLLSIGTLFASLGAASVLAQIVDPNQAAEGIPPYHTHLDRRHGHDHVYPDRGAIVRELPRGATIVNYAGISYRFAGGVWYEPRGPAYIVVAPPIGLLVPALPSFATSVASHGTDYLYADDVYYRSRPDLGGYEVVNDPADSELGETPAAAKAPASESGASSAGAPSAPQPASEASSGAGTPAQVIPLNGPTASAPLETPAVPQSPAAGSVAATAPVARLATVRPPPAAAPPSNIAPPSAAPPYAAPQSPPVAAQTPPPAAPQSAPAAAQAPPPAAPQVAPDSINPSRITVIPENGQTADDQARDRYACYRFAVAQSGFDPLGAEASAPGPEVSRSRSDYARAQAACLEGRGYAVR